MNDAEKAVKGLECCLANDHKACPYHYDDVRVTTCTTEMMRAVLALLKRQEAVEPVVDIDTWKCGNCGNTLEHQELLGDNVLLHEQYNYCPNCGRAVKWW